MGKKITRREFIRTTLSFLAASALSGSFRIEAKPAGDFDLIIKGGTVIDGTGKDGFPADVAVKGDKIVAVGNLKGAGARLILDARGRIVCPGFIDIHAHSDVTPFINPNCESKIHQGVTTELNGNCGWSGFPIVPSDLKKLVKEEYGERKRWSLSELFNLLEKRGTSVNYAILVGHGTVREAVMGMQRRAPTKQELEQMKALVKEAMEQGAFGLSTGLEYPPGMFADTEEIIELCKVVARHGGFYATHMRSEDVKLIEAVEEALEIARRAELPLEISHLKAAGRANYWKMDRVLEMIEKAKKEGIDVNADRYPYTAFSTTLTIFFPEWAHEGGMKKFLARLKDPETRKKMRKETELNVETANSWDNILIVKVKTKKNTKFVGKTVAEAAELAGKDPFNFACDLLLEEKGEVMMVGFGMSEENTIKVLTHPLTMLCSDGSSLAPYGPLSGGLPHPRNYGAFPRFISRYVREKKVLSLPEAIKKMTYMPAQKMGLKGRGHIAEDKFADIVVFDFNTIKDTATFLNPHRYPEGIDYVIVNGKLVIDKGRHTGARAGRILRRA